MFECIQYHFAMHIGPDFWGGTTCSFDLDAHTKLKFYGVSFKRTTPY
jgi:hypothetical protein